MKRKHLFLATIFLFLLAGCSEKDTFIGKESQLRFAHTLDVPQKTVQFTNTSTSNFSRFQWDFGDGTSSKEVSPTHTYRREGTYNIRLMGYNSEADGNEEYTQQITLGESTASNVDLKLNQPSNLDFAGFTLTWTKQNIPSNVTAINLLFSDNENFTNLLQRVNIKDLTQYTFKDLESNKSYWCKAEVTYPVGSKSIHFESEKIEVKTTKFVLSQDVITIESTAADLDVMHFRVHIKEPLSPNLVNKKVTQESLQITSLSGFSPLPVTGLKDTYFKEPNTFLSVRYSATFDNTSDTTVSGLISEGRFLGKQNDNTLWKGMFTKQTNLNGNTNLEVGAENGKRLVFQILNYSTNEGANYPLIPTNSTTLSTQSTVYYLDGSTNEKYYLQTPNVVLKMYRATTDDYFYKLENLGGSTTLTFKQESTSKEINLKALVFAIAK